MNADQAQPLDAAIFSETPIRVECAWCRSVISPGREPVSHGICPGCRDIHFPKAKARLEPTEGTR